MLSDNCLDYICIEHDGYINKGVTTKRDIAIQRNEFLAKSLPVCFWTFKHYLSYFSPSRLRAKYDLFLFKMEEKHPDIYSKIISTLPKTLNHK